MMLIKVILIILEEPRSFSNHCIFTWGALADLPPYEGPADESNEKVKMKDFFYLSLMVTPHK